MSGRRRLAGGLLLLFALGFWAGGIPAATAQPGIVVQTARTELKDEVYYLDARVEYDFSPQILEALRKGVPVTVVMEIEILRQRSYLWDETVATLEQRYQLSYHALSRQYMIRNLNSGAQHVLPSLEAAVSVLGTVVDLPLLDNGLLDPDAKYSARLLARIDVNEFPVPLRLLAWVSSDWSLSSEWYAWPL